MPGVLPQFSQDSDKAGILIIPDTTLGPHNSPDHELRESLRLFEIQHRSDLPASLDSYLLFLSKHLCH
jgi:hypothetical protein